MRARTALAAFLALPLLLAACGGGEEAGITRASDREEAKALSARKGSLILLEFFSHT